MSDWISVKDRLPDTIGSFLGFHDNYYISIVFFNSDKEWCEMWRQEKLKIAHWMPLPKPPETE